MDYDNNDFKGIVQGGGLGDFSSELYERDDDATRAASKAKKKLNLWLLICALLAGLIGFIFAELLYRALLDRIPDCLVVGLCFFVFASVVVGAIFLADKVGDGVFPKKRKNMWILPALPVAFLILGILCQLIYGLNMGKVTPMQIDDYLLVIDNSTSMQSTDPQNKRLQASTDLIQSLTPVNNVGLIRFDRDAVVTAPLAAADTEQKTIVEQAINEILSDVGYTEIGVAVQAAIDHFKAMGVPGRERSILLTTDGESNSRVDIDRIAEQCKAENIRVHTVGMKLRSSFLAQLAGETGGRYYTTDNMEALSGILANIKNDGDRRNLLDMRSSLSRDKAFYGIWRVFTLIILSMVLHLAVLIVSDDNNETRSFVIQGILTGIGAGLAIELGTYFYWDGLTARGLMYLLLSLIYYSTARKQYIPPPDTIVDDDGPVDINENWKTGSAGQFSSGATPWSDM